MTVVDNRTRVRTPRRPGKLPAVTVTSSTAVFPAVPASAAAARQTVSAQLHTPETAGVAALLVSELVTNALLEGDLKPSDTITVHVDPVEGGLRVTVCDSAASEAPAGTGPVEVHRHGGPSGIGLKIVARLARRWGVTSEEHPGARTWFEVDDPAV